MRELHELSWEDYEYLLKSGMLWEFYPEASGHFGIDSDPDYDGLEDDEMCESEEEEEPYITGFSTSIHYSDGKGYELPLFDLMSDGGADTNMFFRFAFELYRQCGFVNELKLKIFNPLFKDTVVTFNPESDKPPKFKLK